jgi:hypothetical protein
MTQSSRPAGLPRTKFANPALDSAVSRPDACFGQKQDKLHLQVGGAFWKTVNSAVDAEGRRSRTEGALYIRESAPKQ